MTECKVRSCHRPTVAFDLCDTHYKRQRRGKNVNGVIRTVDNIDTLACIRSLIAETGIPPTVRELQTCLGLASPSTVHNRLLKLRDQGLIVWDDGKNRSIRVVEGKHGTHD